MMGTRYVGAGVLASAVGMDKHFMKLVLSASGLPVGPFITITPAEWAHDHAACLEAVAALRFPVFVKPARGGSSLGISKVDDRRRRAGAAIEQHSASTQGRGGGGVRRRARARVRRAVRPRRRSPQASAVAEIRVHSASGFYDFEAKYLPEEQVDLDVPALVDRAVADEVRALASGRSRPSAARASPGSTSSSPARAASSSTRSTRCPASPRTRCSRACGPQRPRLPGLVDRLIAARPGPPVGLR